MTPLLALMGHLSTLTGRPWVACGSRVDTHELPCVSIVRKRVSHQILMVRTTTDE